MSKKEIKKLEQKKLEKLNKKYPNAKIISDVEAVRDGKVITNIKH